MDNPVKLVAENPDLKVEPPLTKEEMSDLIKILSFFHRNYHAIISDQCGVRPDTYPAEEAWAICESEFTDYFDKAEALILRIQKINMPKISDDIYDHLKARFSDLEDPELKLALKRILKTHLKMEGKNEQR